MYTDNSNRTATGLHRAAMFLCVSLCQAVIAQGVAFRRGDSDASGNVNITDAVFTLTFLFQGTLRPSCMDAADTNDDGAVDLSDAVGILSYLFGGQQPLQTPTEACLADTTDDDLPACSYAPCCRASQPRVPEVFGSEVKPTLRPGSVITLYGANFPLDRAATQVVFQAGAFRVAGFVTEVRVNPQPPPCDLTPTEIDVVVPTGFAGGNIELLADGHIAGAITTDVAPQIYAAPIGLAEDQECLMRGVDFSFPPGLSRVNFYGFGFNNIQEIRLEDTQGNVQRLPPRAVSHNPTLRCVLESQYEAIGVDLADQENPIRLVFPRPRDNLRISLVSDLGMSNRFEAPVCTSLDVIPVLRGAVIDAVKVPLGVSSGSVEIAYRCHSSEPGSIWTMDFQWTVDEGENWFSALAKEDDPQHDDTEGVRCRSVRFFDDNCQLPAGGSASTFVWDAKNDSGFRAINRERGDPPGRPRAWSVRFRIRPVSEISTIESGDHVVESPDIAYVDMD